MRPRRRWAVLLVHERSIHDRRPIRFDVVDGPFRFRWLAEAAANVYRADEAQRARHDGDAMRQIDVTEMP